MTVIASAHQDKIGAHCLVVVYAIGDIILLRILTLTAALNAFNALTVIKMMLVHATIILLGSVLFQTYVLIAFRIPISWTKLSNAKKGMVGVRCHIHSSVFVPTLEDPTCHLETLHHKRIARR